MNGLRVLEEVAYNVYVYCVHMILLEKRSGKWSAYRGGWEEVAEEVDDAEVVRANEILMKTI